MAKEDWEVYCRDCGGLRRTFSLFRYKPYDEKTLMRMICAECASPDIVVKVLADGVILRDGELVMGGMQF